jgi:hypothetical protein
VASDKKLVNNTVKSVLFSYRFLLEVIVKSMVEHLHATQSLDAPRKMRFSERFTGVVTTLVGTITSDIISRNSKDSKVIAVAVNQSFIHTSIVFHGFKCSLF